MTTTYREEKYREEVLKHEAALAKFEFKTLNHTKPYIAVLRIHSPFGTIEIEFNSGNEAHRYRENIPNWPIITSITLDYDRRRKQNNSTP